MASANPSGSTSTVAVPRIYAFGEFRVDADAGKLVRGEVAIELPSRAFDALVYLIERRDRVVPKDELIQSIWHDVVVTDDSLVHAVSVLRRELGDDCNDPKYVKTIPRRGYRFIGAANTVDTPTEPAFAQADRDVPTAYAPRAATEHRRGSSLVKLTWVAPVAAAALALAVIMTRETEPQAGHHPTSAILFSQPSPPGARIVSSGVLSPDERYLAFVARDDADGKTAIWVRALHSGELRQLSGTDGATKPFWAPDAHQIAFFANRKLLAIDLASERLQTIATVDVGAGGGSWGPDNTILFTDWAIGLYSVKASGEAPVSTIVELDSSMEDIAIAWPQFLPGGRHFLYHRLSLDASRTGTYIGDLATLDSYRLIDTDSPAVFAPPRHLLHVRNGMLIAEELDPSRLDLTGRAIIVARGVSAPSLGADDMMSVAGNLLAFRQRIKRQNLAWFDRTGNRLSALWVPTALYNPRLSPDQSRLLATGSITTDPGLWLASLSREEYARLETDAIAPLWSPDGRSVAFTSRRGFDLVVRAVDDSDANRLILTDTAVKIPNDWSPGGAAIIYTTIEEGTGHDLWTMRIEDGTSRPLLATSFNELQARISPDGEWMAYSSDESGVLEVYVRRYPELGEKRMVSANGGSQPQWRLDQRELFYLSADRTIMAVDVGSTRDGIVFGGPRKLFRTPIAGSEHARDHYVASADGTRFLVDGSIQEGDDDDTLTVMVNWAAEAGERRRDSTSLSQTVSQLWRLSGR